MGNNDKRIKNLIDSSIEREVPNKNRILQSARAEMQLQKQGTPSRTPKMGWSRAKKALVSCVASIVVIVVAVFAISNMDFFNKNDSATKPNVDNGTSFEPADKEDVVFEFCKAYNYKVSSMSKEETNGLGVRYKTIADANFINNNVYYLKDTEEVVMIESKYSMKNNNGNNITLSVATIYDTNSTHVKFEDITEEDVSTYDNKSIQSTYGYKNGEYTMQCLYSNEYSYVLTVMSPDEFDKENFYKKIF